MISKAMRYSMLMNTEMNRSARIRTAFVAAFLAILALPAAAFADTPKHVRVIWEEDPSRAAYISWTTEDPGLDSYVVWDREKRKALSAYAHRKEADLEGPYEDSDGIYYHHAKLEGLTPSTKVHFRVVDQGDETADYYFVTAPDDARPFVYLYGGDSRSSRQTRRLINQRVRGLVEVDPSILVLIHGGDYIMSGGSLRQWRNWLDDWEESITSDNRILPIVPARGNHETDPQLFNRVFAFPGDALDEGDWFRTKLAEDFVLINLDSNVSQAGKQRDWLAEQLNEAQAFRWIAVNYHRPAYPAVKSPGGALYHWVPLFEQYNVNLAMESDGHVLKRTVPIRDGQMDPTGVVYIGEGGLGVPQRTPLYDRWYIQEPGMAMSASHIQAVRVTPDALYYSAILADGSVADTYTIKPNRQGKYVAPSVASMRLMSPTEIEVVFTRPVQPEAAEDAGNYVLQPEVPISNVQYEPEKQVAVIKTAQPVAGLQKAVVRAIGDIAGRAIRPTTFSFPEGGTDLPFEGKLEEVGPGPEPIESLPIGPAPARVDEQTRVRCGAIECSQAASSGGGAGYLALLAGFVLVARRVRRREQ